MPLYMFEAAYTDRSWATQVQDQPDPIARIRPLVEACGGRLDTMYYCFGDYDIVLVNELPDDESAAAVALAASAGGSLRSSRTTKLMSVDEGLSAMRKAKEAAKAYRPPVAHMPQQAGAPAGAHTD